MTIGPGVLCLGAVLLSAFAGSGPRLGQGGGSRRASVQTKNRRLRIERR